VLTHSAVLANVDHVNYWLPYREGGVYLHAAPLFHIADFPFHVSRLPRSALARPWLRSSGPQAFCEIVQLEHVTRSVLVPTMINSLTQFAQVADYDLRQPGGAGVRRIAYCA